ncbi:MAG: class I SAM-dependent methyltransferase [Spirochaetales bacterium]|nr:class I SAM-dependent methyltransferase [Spirochaetales bacterium]
MKRKERIREYYLPKLKNEKSDSGCLGWENEQAQELRFEVLKNIFFHGASVLDVGCGLGNLYDYLKKQDYNFKYTGVDILPEMIFRAKEKNPQAEFFSANIFAFLLIPP